LLHLPRVKKISAIEENRVRHRSPGAFEIQLLELIPFRGDNKRVATRRLKPRCLWLAANRRFLFTNAFSTRKTIDQCRLCNRIGF
jgi:hypothetical protein